MRRFAFFVNLYFLQLRRFRRPFLLCFAAPFSGEANYNQAAGNWQALFGRNRFCGVK
jgi:hypothetical protein